MDSALNFAPCGYLSFTDDGTIVEVNQTLSALLGYPENSLSGKNVELLLSLASKIFYNTHLFPLLRLQGHANEIFISLKTISKVNIPVVSNFLRRNEENKVIFHATFIVVYQRKKFEDELINARNVAEQQQNNSDEVNDLRHNLELKNQELDKTSLRQHIIDDNLAQLSKIVSHDMQEPIRKTKIFLDQLFIENSTQSDKGQLLISKIRKANERIELLSKGLFQFIDMESAGNSALVNLNLEFAKALELAREHGDFNDFTIEVAELPNIEGHNEQLQLLFYNLITNSIQFRDESRALTVRVASAVVQENAYLATPDRYRYVNYLKIKFSDNGTGFENEYNDHVFDMVRKLEPKGRGIGLGLSLAKKIVENHSGTIRIESELGKGSSVIILLPISQH